MSTNGAPIVKAEEVEKYFGRNRVLCGVSLEVKRGEVVCIIGPSGSGKTTFLRCINHLERIDGGRIEVNGHLIGYRPGRNDELVEDSERNIAQQRTEIGFVFQRFNLWPHKTALQNIIEAPVRVRKTKPEEAVAQGEALLARVGLADKRNAYPGRLSGGQQQRVAIARALVNRPRLLLADEPTGNLDSGTSRDVMALLRQLNATQQLTLVVVTHDPEVARQTDRVLVMRDGLVVADGPPAHVLAATAGVEAAS